MQTQRDHTRTCVGCRAATDPAELVRVVADPSGRVALDARGTHGGRGAWVHPTRACVANMVKRHAAERSLKVEVQKDLDAGKILGELRAALARKADSLIVVASRTRAVAIGADAVADALEKTRVPLVLVAKDAGQVAAALADAGKGGDARVVRYATKMELGRLFGRGEVALLALLDGRIASEMNSTLDRLAALED